MTHTAMKRFEGQVVLISGGAGAIGQAIARRLASEGAIVWLADLSEPDASLSRAAFDGLPAPHALSLDVTQPDSWSRAVGTVLQRHGRLDVLVNNAGVIATETEPVDRVSLADWQRVFHVNVDGTLLGIQAAMSLWRGRGARGVIVNIGSIAGYVGSHEGSAYGASKAAVRNLTKQAALSAAREGLAIRVNAVHPGYVWTQLVDQTLTRRYGSATAALEAVRAMNPMRRIVEPDDVAASVAFLASDDARAITGADLVVDGGRLIQ